VSLSVASAISSASSRYGKVSQRYYCKGIGMVFATCDWYGRHTTDSHSYRQFVRL
jgi:hypothetical protein